MDIYDHETDDVKPPQTGNGEVGARDNRQDVAALTISAAEARTGYTDAPARAARHSRLSPAHARSANDDLEQALEFELRRAEQGAGDLATAATVSSGRHAAPEIADQPADTPVVDERTLETAIYQPAAAADRPGNEQPAADEPTADLSLGGSPVDAAQPAAGSDRGAPPPPPVPPVARGGFADDEHERASDDTVQFGRIDDPTIDLSQLDDSIEIARADIELTPMQEEQVLEQATAAALRSTTSRLDRRAAQREVLAIARGLPLGDRPLHPQEPRQTEEVMAFPNRVTGMPGDLHMRYRAALLDTYTVNPDAARTVVRRGVVGIHASGSASLLPSVRDGLRPLSELREAGEPIVTGTRDAAGAALQQATSFVPFASGEIREAAAFTGMPLTEQTLDDAIQQLEQAIPTFARQNPTGVGLARLEAMQRLLPELRATRELITRQPADAAEAEQQRLIRENFPVVWGLRIDGLQDNQLIRPISRVRTEFAVRDLQRQDTPVVFVPREKVAEVEGYARRYNSQVSVLAIEDVPELARAIAARTARQAVEPAATERGVGLIDRFITRARNWVGRG